MSDAFLVIGALMIMFSLGAIVSKSNFEEQAIERGFAYYCPNNGEWAWKGECDK